MRRLTENHRMGARYGASVMLAAVACLLAVAPGVEASNKFERTYNPQGPAHLTISNVNGEIMVATWNKKSIGVRATTAASVVIDDQVSGDEITISVKRNLRLGRADFEVYVPTETSVSIKHMMGKIEVQGLSGHISINSIDSDVRLAAIRSPSIEVKVTSGDISFDGELQGGGPYSLQSMKGDIDVSLPANTPFNLDARALSENINLGDFLSSLISTGKGPKGISGLYLQGGPRLSLTTYAGRILLHRK